MRLGFGLFALAAVCTAWAAPSLFEQVAPGVYLVRDDNGNWAGDWSKDVTHQCAAGYEAKKILDLSGVPEKVWNSVREVRLSAFFCVRDYSWHDRPPADGLDEAFEVVVNGRVHTYPTNCGAPVFEEGHPRLDWYDFDLPKEEFSRGANEVIFRKAADQQNDDYLYLGIDLSARRGNSAVTFDGREWRTDVLTVPGGVGEYMVRLYLITRDMHTTAEWRPAARPDVNDPDGLIVFAGSQFGRLTPQGLRLEPGQTARLEWPSRALDTLRPIEAAIQASRELLVAWLDLEGRPLEAERMGPGAELSRPPKSPPVSGLELTAADEVVTLKALRLSAHLSYRPQEPPIDMCPAIAAPAGRPPVRQPTCSISGRTITLSNTGLTCRFQAAGRLRLISLRNAYADCETLLAPSAAYLFLVEVDGERYAGTRDFRCVSVRPVGKTGFAATLELSSPALRAVLEARIEKEGLRLALRLANTGPAPVDFKLCFPHLAGLTASGSPAADYYFFPWGGGIIADRPAYIRRGYGDHEAIYQVMDLFSPARGAGLYVRADDAEGWHKTLALRKFVSGQGWLDARRAYLRTAEEYKWQDPLEPVEGVGLAYEYERRTRGPGEEFRPADAVLAAHPGDWRTAMRAYADWAHRVWRFRPWPSRLRTVHHMLCAGWDGDILFRDGKYRTDFITPVTDCIELMSWWEWSPVGPWGTPFDRLSEVLTPDQIKLWEPYFVKDPVTGQTMWNNQPGDYDGYNERFGGLPAFRQAIETYKRMGALVTLYTDPIRCDASSKVGQRWGELFCVVGPDGKYVTPYDVWTPCHDVEEYRRWVADTMKRVMLETGADGLRLDEYGHAGWACFSTRHKHSFAEPGVSQWGKAIAETTRLVRAAMDEINPALVLTTEHPGYDYLLQFLEGCITYDLSVQATPLRPLECNLQRFFFPECKAYELDYSQRETSHRRKFWNAVESFGTMYPAPMYAALCENEDAYQSRDCQPFIPTLARYVYANRFAAPTKIVYHLYNASGHTVSGPLIEVNLKPSEHLFDVLRGCEVAPQRIGSKTVISAYLPRDEILCVAQLPRLLRLSRAGSNLVVVADNPPQAAQLSVCAADGKRLATQPARAGRNSFDLAALPGDARPVCVKLLVGRDLRDAAEIPPAR